MNRWLAAYLGAALVVAWAVLRVLRGRPAPEPWVEPYAEPEWDTYQAAILR